MRNYTGPLTSIMHLNKDKLPDPELSEILLYNNHHSA